jgi:acyl carrier protein
MKYFGIEIFDGKIYSDFPLEENEPLSSQWFFLSDDVGGINYVIREFSFCIDISWFGDAMNVSAPENGFRLKIMGGRETECKIYSLEFVEPNLAQLKSAMQRAVDFVQLVRKLSDEDIDALPLIEVLINFIRNECPGRNITPDTILFDDLGISRHDALNLMSNFGSRFNISLSNFDARIFSISEEELEELSESQFISCYNGSFRKDNQPILNFSVQHLHKVIHKGEWFDPEK